MLQSKLFESFAAENKNKTEQNIPKPLHLQKRKIHEPPLIMLYSEFSSPFFLSLPSGTLLRLPVDSAKH